MGAQVTIEGFPFAIEIEGETVNDMTKEEFNRIDKLVSQLKDLETLPGVAEMSPERQEFLEEQTEKYGLSEQYESTKENIKAINAKRLLKELGFYDDTDETPLEKIGIDRDDFVIAGSMIGSVPGYRDLFKLKNLKMVSPSQMVIAGGKIFFGGTFGQLTMGAAHDIANYILSGKDPKMLTFMNELDDQTREAIYFEAVGLAIPEVLAAGWRGLTNLKDPMVQTAYRAAERLGIQLSFGQIAKYAPLSKALSPLPFIGGGVRGYVKKQGKKLQLAYEKILEQVAPISTFSRAGHNIFERADKRFETRKKLLSKLWQKAFDSHAMLPDKNIFNSKTFSDSFGKLFSGDVLRQLKNVPLDKNGSVIPWNDLVKSGWFDKVGLSRLTGDGVTKDIFGFIRRAQEDIRKQGGQLSYEQIRNFNAEITNFFNSVGSKDDKKIFYTILSNFREGLDDVLKTSNIDTSKVPAEMLETIIQTHSGAMSFTKAMAKLYESPAGNIFGKFEKNIFQPGFITSKKSRDELLDVILKTKSPDTLNLLVDIVGPVQGKEIIKEFIDRRFTQAMITSPDAFFQTSKSTSGIQFDPGKLNEVLGWGSKRGLTGDFTDQLFKIAGINKKHIQDIIQTGAFLENIKITDPSTFLQRRFQITGLKGALNAVFLGAGYKGGETFLESDDGIFTKGIKGIISLYMLRYGIGKVFANPGLAKKIADVFDPLRAPRFKTKISILSDLFNMHHAEHPEEKSETFEMLSDIRNNISDKLKDVDLDSLNEMIDGLELEIYRDKNIENIKETLDENEELDERVIQEDSQLNVPQVNQEFDMESVVPPMADPAQAARSGDINPEIIEQMASLGMPLFGNEGGIASLMKHKKPQQMVA